MTAVGSLLVLIPISYVLGSIPFGLVVGLAKGKDPRLHGSGNIGATNVGRMFGRRWFFAVFLLDMFKGMLPMLAAGWVLQRAASVGDAAVGSPASYGLWLGVGVGAILGHVFSLFLRFQGGKGVATSAGVLLGLWPFFTAAAAVCLAIFVVVVSVSRYISLGSIVAAAMFPIAYLAIGLAKRWPVFGAQWPLLVGALVVAGLVIAKHRANMVRLQAGTEHKIGGGRGEHRGAA